MTHTGIVGVVDKSDGCEVSIDDGFIELQQSDDQGDKNVIFLTLRDAKELQTLLTTAINRLEDATQ